MNVTRFVTSSLTPDFRYHISDFVRWDASSSITLTLDDFLKEYCGTHGFVTHMYESYEMGGTFGVAHDTTRPR